MLQILMPIMCLESAGLQETISANGSGKRSFWKMRTAVLDMETLETVDTADTVCRHRKPRGPILHVYHQNEIVSCLMMPIYFFRYHHSHPGEARAKLAQSMLECCATVVKYGTTIVYLANVVSLSPLGLTRTSIPRLGCFNRHYKNTSCSIILSQPLMTTRQTSGDCLQIELAEHIRQFPRRRKRERSTKDRFLKPWKVCCMGH